MNESERPAVRLSPDARRLARAAADLDTELITRLVRASVDLVGVIPTWEQLVQPVWRYLGARPDAAGEGSISEHVYVLCAMRALAVTDPAW